MTLHGRRARGAIAIAALVGVIVVVIGGHYIRPAIVTHLLAFALGILYATTVRRGRKVRRRYRDRR